MSEYDYSPAARERYIQTQNRVSDWINKNSINSSQFPAYPRPYSAPSSRSHTPSVTPSQSISHAVSDYRAPSSHHSRHSRHSRSHSHSRAPAYYTAPQVIYSQTTPSVPASIPVTYQNGQYLIPPPHPGEQYVIIPSRGQQVHVINPPPTASAYNYPKAKHDSLLKRLFTSFGPSHSRRLDRRRSH